MHASTARPTRPRSTIAFAAAAAALIGLSAALLALALKSPASTRALVTSAMAAWVVQVIAFAIARWAVPRPTRPIMTAWGVGMILRFGAVVAYALIAGRTLELPPVPALLSFVIFLFVSTLLEPFFLRS
jgi:hypothetical protein